MDPPRNYALVFMSPIRQMYNAIWKNSKIVANVCLCICIPISTSIETSW